MSNILTVFQREFKNYFNTAIGYVFLAIFSLTINFLFFYLPGFWDANVASMDNFFSWIRIVYIFFIPAITMRLWAEEKKTGTIEVLFTLPYRSWEIIIGKYLSALAFLAVALCSTLLIPISLGIISSPDWMIIIGGYLGVLFLGSSYIALGLYISWMTQDQIVAFLVSMAVSFLFFIMGYPHFLQFMGPLSPVVAFISLSWHFESLSRGLFDSRDIIFFITFSFLCLYFNYNSIESRR